MRGTKSVGLPKARAALVAGVTAVALGVIGLTAGGASAAVSCSGSNIVGEGAAMQGVAQQQVWIPGFEVGACHGKGPTVGYVSSSSGAGLAQWSAFGGTTINNEREFIGTTMAPDETEMENIRVATQSQNEEGEESEVMVVPVAQSAIALIANPPAGCTITSIKRQALERVLRGTKKTWGDIGTASGSCNSPITRVVPSEISGVSYQVKHYLSLVDGGELVCTTAPGNTWAALQSSSLNSTWPEACKGHKGLTVVKHTGDEVGTVNANPGSIGFAGLAEAETAKAGATTVLALENGTKPKGGATFASPAIGAQSNCGAATYAVPAEAQVGAGSGLDVDWSSVYGSSLESTTYPLCTLTFDVALQGYGFAGFTVADAVSVKDYLFWYLLEGKPSGEEELVSAGKWYAALPATGSAATDVLKAARFTASKIH